MSYMSGDDDEGTITPEVQLKEVEERLGEETDRLLKLYDAYEIQEKEMVNLKAEIEVLEKEIVEREIEKDSLEGLLNDKDSRIRDLELKSAKSSKQVDFLEPELQKMEEKYTREKERLGKVFGITEELDNDLRLAVSEMKARDDWYVNHMSLFEDLNKAIKERYELIEQAVEAERQSQHMQRAIQERMDEMIEVRAAEMTIDEAESTIESDVKSTEDSPVEEDADEEKEDAKDDSTEKEEASVEEETEDREVKDAESWSDEADPWAEHDDSKEEK